MDKKEIKEQYLKKISLVNKYNKFYYDKSKPLVDDIAYDELKSNILLLDFFSREIFFSIKVSFSLRLSSGMISSENFPKKISAIFLAVISISLEPTCAIFPPTFASTI